jgi:hypothetical protein
MFRIGAALTNGLYTFSRDNNILALAMAYAQKYRPSLFRDIGAKLGLLTSPGTLVARKQLLIASSANLFEIKHTETKEFNLLVGGHLGPYVSYSLDNLKIGYVISPYSPPISPPPTSPFPLS